jgi:hypothetical protein
MCILSQSGPGAGGWKQQQQKNKAISRICTSQSIIVSESFQFSHYYLHTLPC